MTEAAIRVGVLGATGYIGEPYRREIRAVGDAQIVALCARRRNLLEAAGRADGTDFLTHEWREVVDHPDVNFVVVATPDALHYEAVLACAEAGKHVLCEKPVAKTATEAEAMWKAFRKRPELAHFVPVWTRYVAATRRAKEISDSGELGEIRGVVYRWHNPRPANMPLTWRDDAALSAGGSIADVGSHAYDTMSWMMRDQAVRVLVHSDTLTPAKPDLGDINLSEAIKAGAAQDATAERRKGTTPDYANISWKFSNGAVGILVVSHAGFFRKGLCPELELHGTKASLAVNRVTGDIFIGHPDRIPERVDNIPDRHHENRFDQFVFPVVRSRLNGVPSPEHPNLKHGYHVQRFTDAALESGRNGGWVDV